MTTTTSSPHPWRVRQRPAGDWEVSRFNYGTGNAERWGLYPTEQKARDVQASLNRQNTALSTPLKAH